MSGASGPAWSRARARARLGSITGLAAFRHRNYRLFFAGQGISLVGTWMTQVAQSWLVLQLTGDPFDLGLVAAFQFLPVLVLGLFGGLLADALPKRPTMYVTQAVAMAVSLTLFALSASGVVQLWHVFALAVVMGVRNSIDMPTRQAFAVEMVGREDVVNAVALNAAMFNAARIVGPAVAGLTIGAFGVPIAFLVDGLSFLAVLLGLFAMTEHELQPAPRIARMRSPGAVLDNLVEGLAYVRSTSVVLLAIVMVGVVGTFGINFSIVIPPLADDVLRVGASGFGFLMAASGVGSMIAALLVAFGGTRPRRIVLGAVALGLAEMVIGVTHSFAADLGLMFVAGFGAITMMSTVNTTIQLAVPDGLRGRVMSVYTTVFAGASPVGGLAVGAIASSVGVQAAIFLGGAVSLAMAVVGVLWFRRIDARAGTGAGGTTDAGGREAPSDVRPEPAPAPAPVGGLAPARGSARR